MTPETTAQKTARLRALRHARDGSPDENRKNAQAAKAANRRQRLARMTAAAEIVTDAMKTEEGRKTVLNGLFGRK